jgi:fatty acid desaturase
MTAISISDPKVAPKPSLLERWALSMIHDPRDLPFVRLSVEIMLVLVPFAVLLYIPGVFRWWLAPIYMAVNMGLFFDRYILMLHNTSHRPLFKPPYRKLNRVIPWFLGPFFGETPETYYSHHMGMHHADGNLPNDLSTTMPFQRDSVLDFHKYFFKFLFSHPAMYRYFTERKRYKLWRRFLTGELMYLAITVGLAFISWQATLVVFWIPLLMARYLMMAGNWAQHAFVCAEQPDNDYRASITCINTRYNRRCFNDGYHIGHHVRANRHWTELPQDFLDNRETYREQKAIVFEGIDFFGVWFWLMLKRYDVLVKHFVDLEDEPRSKKEIIALLKERTRKIPC